MIWRGVWAVIFAILLAGSARADSTVPNLSPATNLTGGELYLAQTGASDNKLGLTTSVFCLSGGSMTLCPGSIGTSLLSAGAALGNIGAGGINSTYLASGTALANIGAAGVTSSYLASGAALANIGTLNNAQFIGYGAGSGSGAAQPVTIQAGTGASFNCTGGVCTIGATGSGGVSGPGSSVNGDIVIWNGSAGNALADGGVLLSALAPLNSPALIGTPTAPTAASSTNTTQIATTAFVKGQGYLAAPVALSSFANQANNTVVGNISGGAAPPSALTQTQLTALCNIFSSTLAGCVPASGGGTSNWLRADGAWAAPPGSGTVTSVGMTGDGTIYNSSVTGSPVTSSGVLAPSLKTQTANTVLSGPTSGSAAAPTFRALVAADMPTSVTDGTHTQTAVGTFSLGAGLQTTTGSSGTAPINLVSPDRTVTSPPTIGSGDMAGQVNVDLSTTGAVTIPAISSSVFPTGAGALLPNSGTAGYTFSSTPTINGLPWATIYPGGFVGMVSNGTSLDAFGWPGFGAISGDCTVTAAGAITCTKTNGTAFGTFATANAATPPAIGGTTPAAGGFTTLSASSTASISGVLTYGGAASGTVANWLGVDASNHVVTGTPPGSTTITTNPGLGNSASVFNGLNGASLQTITNSSNVYPQFTSIAKTANYTLNNVASGDCASGVLCDQARLLWADGSGSIQFTAPNPSGVLATYQMGDQTGHGYTVTTAGGSATFYGCVTGSPTSLTAPANTVTILYDSGSTYGCTFLPQQALGTAAYQNTGTSGGNVGLLNGNNTYSGNNTHSGTETFSGSVIGTAAAVTLTSNNYTASASDCGTTKLLPTGSTPTVTLPNLNQNCAISFVTTAAISYQFVAASGGSTQNSQAYSHTRGSNAGDTVTVIIVTPSSSAAKWSISGDLTS